jgi:GntR family transcriptional regulator
MKRDSQSAGSVFAFQLNGHSGVPVYRQLIDQIQGAIARGALRTGDQLPTVRHVAVELEINPNTVLRAYREMEIRGILDTQQGTGTFIAERLSEPARGERDRQLALLASEFASRAGASGFTISDLVKALNRLENKQ